MVLQLHALCRRVVVKARVNVCVLARGLSCGGGVCDMGGRVGVGADNVVELLFSHHENTRWCASVHCTLAASAHSTLAPV